FEVRGRDAGVAQPDPRPCHLHPMRPDYCRLAHRSCHWYLTVLPLLGQTGLSTLLPQVSLVHVPCGTPFRLCSSLSRLTTQQQDGIEGKTRKILRVVDVPPSDTCSSPPRARRRGPFPPPRCGRRRSASKPPSPRWRWHRPRSRAPRRAVERCPPDRPARGCRSGARRPSPRAPS